MIGSIEGRHGSVLTLWTLAVVAVIGYRVGYLAASSRRGVRGKTTRAGGQERHDQPRAGRGRDRSGYEPTTKTTWRQGAPLLSVRAFRHTW